MATARWWSRPIADEVIGINSRAELADAEGRWQAARREQAMADGATLIAPETVWFAYDTQVGRDVMIEPNVFFGPGVTIADGATIRAIQPHRGRDGGRGRGGRSLRAASPRRGAGREIARSAISSR